MMQIPEKSQIHLSKPMTLALVICIPMLYLLLNAVSSNQYIALVQIFIFIIPSLILNQRFHFFSWPQINKKSILIMTTLLSFFLILTILLNQALQVWQNYFPVSPQYMDSFEKLFHLKLKYGFLFDILTLSLIPAIGEEFFFRGFFLTSLTNFYSNWTSIFVSSFFFALYHVNPAMFIFYFILGFLFGLMKIKTNNMALSILAHFTVNAYGVYLFYQMNQPI